MKARVDCAVFLCLILLTTFSFAVAHEYQAGRIVKVEKVEKEESNGSSAGPDAPLKAEVETYRISIQLGDKVYVCRYKVDEGDDLLRMKGKNIQARVSGKTMYVKTVTGKQTKGHILSTSNSKNDDLN